MDCVQDSPSPSETVVSNAMSSVADSSTLSTDTRDTDVDSCVDVPMEVPDEYIEVENPPAVREAITEEIRSMLTSLPPEILRGKYTTLPGERPKPGLDRSLPPISKIEDIFEDLTSRALQNGLGSFLDHIGPRKLRVATMCSGTESPLLALEMIQDSLRRLVGRTFRLHHLFSAEIDAFKQSYIQRNFAPDIIFRDVNELVAEEATTAFGSVRKVPTNPDLLVVGFSCVDFSALNFYRKTLEEMGESGHTFYGVLRYIQRCRPPLVVLENVCSAPWEKIKIIMQEADYNGYHMKLDSKNYYLPQTRERGYMICVDQRKLITEPVGEMKTKKLSSFAQMMKKLERPASSPVTQFLLSNDDTRLQDAVSDISINSTKDRQAVDWTRYKARHLGYRMREGLGDKRPLTKWQDNGTCQMPDFYWHGWSRTQTERVWDTLDVNYLRTMARGYDIGFKSRVIDLSQGLDRELDQRASGIAGCLTPRGQHFITSRGGPLLGIEALALQGIPIDRLLISNDSQRDLHDLAGNAMTSTVVGAVIASALILGYQALPRYSALFELEASEEVIPPVTVTQNDQMTPMETNVIVENTLSTTEIYQLALRTSRLCYCDGQIGTRTEKILVCTLCNHTACSKCGKNPTHLYKRVDADDLKQRLSPIDFQTQIKTKLPMRLQVSGIAADMFDQFRESTESPDVVSAWDAFLEAVKLTFGEVLKFRGITRQCGWTITYEGANSLLKLSCTSIGLQWSLYATPSKKEPSSSPLRQILSHPIAKMSPTSDNILDGTWLVGSPVSSEFDMSVTGCGPLVDSLPARSGLQHPKFRNLKTWSVLRIDAKDEDIENLEADIRGDYELLPDCGSASGSLRKRLFSAGAPIYLFLDPTEIGPHQLDSWVFAVEHGRLDFGQSRDTIAEIRPNWNPWYLDKEQDSVQCWYRKWRKSHIVSLNIYRQLGPPRYGIPNPEAVPALCSLTCDNSYATMLHCSIPAGCSELEMVPGVWEQENLLESTVMLQKFAWLLQKATGITQFENWMDIETSKTGFILGCSTCAPQKPRLAWALDDRDRVYAYENPEDAAAYERSIKNRPAPFLGFSVLDEHFDFHLRICLNVMSLLHRAAGNLASKDNILLQWRLCIDTTGFIQRPLPKLLERNNKLDTAYSQPPGFRHYHLRPEQLRSLQWMCNQESDKAPPFEEQEVVEALLPTINWRAEGKASIKKTVLGGILGDEVGYASTSLLKGAAYYTMMENFVAAPELPKGEGRIFVEWLQDVLSALSDQVDRLVNSGASKVLDHVHDRREELRRGNGLSKYKPSRRLKGQKFQEHLLKIRQLAAGDEHEKDTPVQTTDGEHAVGFTDGLGKRKRTEPAIASSTEGVSETRDLKKQKKGSNGARKDGGADQIDIFNLQDSGEDWKSVRSPLLHMFEFSRVIIDEFTYSKDRNYAAALAISSRKKWILSGTPPLNNFGDVKSFSPFLGINLGIDEDDGRKVDNERLKTIQREKTEVEQFQPLVTRRSAVWHQRRHEVAQGFLDQFMRKNMPDIDDIPWTEHVIGVALSAAERAVYLELFMQLMSQNLRLRKHGRGIYDSDEIARLDEIIGNSSGPEEALSKRCSLFTLADVTHSPTTTSRENPNKSFEDDNPLVVIRHKQLIGLGADIGSRLSRGLWLRGQLDEGTTHFDRLLESIEEDRFGDLLVTIGIKNLLRGEVSKFIPPNPEFSIGADFKEKKKNPDDPRPEFPKTQTELISDLNYCTDSLRRLVYETVSHARALRLYHADDKLANYGGSKLAEVINLLQDTKRIPSDDQALLFIQFPELMDAAAHALQLANILHTVVQPGDRTPASKISEFQNGKDVMKSKVLILNLGDVTASGLTIITPEWRKQLDAQDVTVN
ncbi:uncharacterized protein GIQ15_05680 [Arthroderma uncinatum]|uniref:uncharacterized protein n=1 Tax=Arthroderma uncinatum TaxID=74035 RepID=UPI00144A4F46|nr:uncharacterized protein GIQ15_05680 [Arthroderma uncinatum]KAF3480333.1 hypothetical protein GIQ15_05680 [Arthroderma uncinatum]